jgi:hypothetical protein
MRAREFIREQVASLAAPVVAPALAPIKQAVGNVTKDFVKGATTKMPDTAALIKQAKQGPGTATGIGLDKANDAWGYTQAGGDEWIASQARQNLTGRAIQGVAKTITPDKAALRAATDSPVKSAVMKAAPRTLGMLGTAVRTGTGLAPTLMTYSKELGPETPKVGPYRGSELSPLTGGPWTREELDAFNDIYANWKPEYDPKSKEMLAKYDSDNPIRTAIRNKTGIELPFGSPTDAFIDPKYNPGKHLPKLVNDPLEKDVKQAQADRMEIYNLRRDIERQQSEIDNRKPNVK